MRKLDAHIRRRLRAILLRHWKRKRTIVRNLIALGVKRRSAWKGIYQGKRSWWALSHSYPVDQGLRTRYFGIPPILRSPDHLRRKRCWKDGLECRNRSRRTRSSSGVRRSS